ncbi:MAG: thioesterase family protein [Proteobacteria bacterium]|nr:thioesterase family protein [Pseudomonadota bacterium]
MAEIFEGPLVVDRVITWRDCDPTELVYPPRFLDFVAEAVEAWFSHVFGFDWYGLRKTLGLGSPIVHTSLDFSHPVRVNDRLSLIVLIDEVGRSSLPFRMVGRRGTEPVLRAKMVISIIDLADRRPTSIPTDLRDRIQAYQRACESLAATGGRNH